MKWALLGLTAIVAAAVAWVYLGGGLGPRRPETRLLAADPAAAPPAASFVIRDAPPTAATPVPTKPDLDAVMQRMRSAQTPPTVPVKPDPAPVPAVVTPAPPPPAAPVAPAPVDAAPRWSNVSGQGTRWRMNRSPAGMSVSIDLGGGQTAEVKVAPAFANLDAAAANTRIDYLRQTILSSFSNRSATYSFGRDGSISLEP